MNRARQNLLRAKIAFTRSLFAVLASLSFFGPFSVSAQITKSSCPEIDESATAAEQSICWFQRDKSGAPDCVSQETEMSFCIAQTTAWCAEASFDAEPVTTACLLASIRAGQLKEAKEIAGYLISPSKTAEACAAILKRANIQIVTNPANAEVMVNDRSYGKAPVEVRLLGDWWESQIKARFAGGPETVDVAVSSEELLNTFDRKECVFGDLVITGPPLPQLLPEIQVKEQRNGALSAKQPSVESSDSDWLLWTSISSAAAGVASGVLATVFLLDGESDNDYYKQMCPGGCYEGDINTSQMETKYQVGTGLMIGGSLLIVGSVTTGIIYLNGINTEEEKTHTDISIRLTGQDLKVNF